MGASTRWVLGTMLVGLGCGTPSTVYVRDGGGAETTGADVAVDGATMDVGAIDVVDGSVVDVMGDDRPGDASIDRSGQADILADVPTDTSIDQPSSPDIGTDVPSVVDVGMESGADVLTAMDIGVDTPVTTDVGTDVGTDVPRVCSPGAASCADGNTRRVCNADGLGYTSAACPAATNAAGSCSSGICGISCATGFGNCDADAANGCEASFMSSSLHCGTCGVACGVGSSCASGVCAAANRCTLPSSTRCGSDILSSWSWRAFPSATCSEPLVARSFSSVAGTTALSACSDAVDLVGNGSYAELAFPAIVATCSSPTPFTVSMVGRLPTNYQRNLEFVLRWTSGESVRLSRWVWNSASESSVDVQVTGSTGTAVNYMSSSANTGGAARADRPWGWNIGNNGSWWRMTVTVDSAADLVTATFEQPSQSSLVYTATYSTPIPDTALPSLRVSTVSTCGLSIDNELLSLTANPPLWW